MNVHILLQARAVDSTRAGHVPGKVLFVKILAVRAGRAGCCVVWCWEAHLLVYLYHRDALPDGLNHDF